MRTLVVADTAYGNTWTIAEAVAATIGEAPLRRAAEVTSGDLQDLELLVIGSPTQGGRPLPAVSEFLKGLPDGTVKQLAFASFDTRIDVRRRGFGLKALLAVIGYAAPKLARELSRRGAHQVVPPEGFIVEDREGPLREGELERARQWANQIAAIASKEQA